MTTRVATVLALALLGLVGCGGGDDGGAKPRPATSAPTSTATTAEPSATDTSSSTTDSYLPVPAGRELTTPGTELRFGEGALAAWLPRQDVVGVVGVRLTKVEVTTVEKSLQGFRLDDTEASSTPYFVTVEVGNGGDTDLGGRQLPFYVVDTDGDLVPPTGIANDFKPCPGGVLPTAFAPGASTTSCLVFLVPVGSRLASVMFRPPEGVLPITWVGRPRPLGAKPAKGRRR